MKMARKRWVILMLDSYFTITLRKKNRRAKTNTHAISNTNKPIKMNSRLYKNVIYFYHLEKEPRIFYNCHIVNTIYFELEPLLK